MASLLVWTHTDGDGDAGRGNEEDEAGQPQDAAQQRAVEADDSPQCPSRLSERQRPPNRRDEPEEEVD